MSVHLAIRTADALTPGKEWVEFSDHVLLSLPREYLGWKHGRFVKSQNQKNKSWRGEKDEKEEDEDEDGQESTRRERVLRTLANVMEGIITD